MNEKIFPEDNEPLGEDFSETELPVTDTEALLAEADLLIRENEEPVPEIELPDQDMEPSVDDVITEAELLLDIPEEDTFEVELPQDEDAFAAAPEEDFAAESPAEPEENAPEEAIEAEASSEYMENYPVLPDSAEEPQQDAAPESFDDGGEFQQMFEKKDPEDTKRAKKERPARKGRPRRRKGYGLLGIPNLLASVIWLLLVVAIGVSLGRMIWICAADVLAFGRESREVTISITSEDTMESIAGKLHDAGLVRYPQLFLLFADLTDVEEEGKITTGTFTLNTIYDYNALISNLSPRSGNRVVIEDVLIPEGYSCRQIFALLEEKGICKAADLEEWAANGELDDYWFLEGVERGDKYCLEGFLFPDTYDFYENSTPKAALEKMLDGFDYRFSEEVYALLPALNEKLSEMMRENGCSADHISENQLDLRDLITVASLIEEETANNKESFKIASVIYNRLTQNEVHERYLNIDAAIFYALGEHKEALTAEDLQIDSPYNTYLYSGLVPGPISNPGLASIDAALRPEDTDYYYYVLDPETGEHRFSKTYAEHEKNIADIRGE